MTERNFTTVIPGFYRTRGGELAEIVQILDPRLESSYPVRGLMGRYQEAWTIEGFGVAAKPDSQEDLLTFLGTEKPRERRARMQTLTRWANIYEGGDVVTFATRQIADARGGQGRIACVGLTGEYEVEEDV